MVTLVGVRVEHLRPSLAEHQMGFAKEFADRVCFFYQGRICEQGRPEKIFGAPENERTRQFLRAVLEAS
jgi:polar amino acid transport system ATP-binding protein